MYPLVAVSLPSSDAPDDLVKQGFNLAIWLGTLAGSSLKRRRIGAFQRILVTAPDYLATRPPIRSVQEIAPAISLRLP
ncbi:LysR substrate-binding domain-containing protein [Sulfitobacter sp.]|uniref:LysR substrate-binding domain-containing protein n=1 Tax=Sulfitobacter sp. TaxID=1903071 RepID=UPI0030025F44